MRREVSWRDLYCCSNGWRGLREDCFEVTCQPAPTSHDAADEPVHCFVEPERLGWTATAGADWAVVLNRRELSVGSWRDSVPSA